MNAAKALTATAEATLNNLINTKMSDQQLIAAILNAPVIRCSIRNWPRLKYAMAPYVEDGYFILTSYLEEEVSFRFTVKVVDDLGEEVIEINFN